MIACITCRKAKSYEEWMIKKFKGTNAYKRFSNLYDLGKDLEPEFNAFGFTPSELKKYSHLTTLRDALETGVVIS